MNRSVDEIRKYTDNIKKQIKGTDLISILAVFNMGTTRFPGNTLDQLIDDIENLCEEVEILAEAGGYV